ncbi:MAG: cell division protein SepF, partial [Pelosinus sp.]|nr:cell division protein SepF [Pelosinus sp.]
MPSGLINKFTNFFMAEEEENVQQEAIVTSTKAPHLKLHTPAELKMCVSFPCTRNDIFACADHLKAKRIVIINIGQVRDKLEQSMLDFLSGVCYVLGGSVQSISAEVLLFVPAGVEIDQELYGYSVPTFPKCVDELSAIR